MPEGFHLIHWVHCIKFVQSETIMNRTVWRPLGCLLFIFLLLAGGCRPKEPTLEEKVAQAEALLDAGQIETAIRLLNLCLEEGPARVDVLETLAFAHAAQGDPLFAAMIFIQIAELVPERAEYRLYAAESFREGGDEEGAIEQYRVYLLTHPSDISVWVTLADLYEDRGTLGDALECLLAAEQIEGRSRNKVRIGRLYIARSNLAQAQAWFSRSLEDPATREQALLGLLETAIRAKRFADGEALLLRLDAEYPGRLDQSELAVLRPQLLEWRRHQDAAAAALAAIQERPAAPPPDPQAAESPEDAAVGPATAETVSNVETEDSAPAESPELSEPVAELPAVVLPPDRVAEARALRESGDLRAAVNILKEALVEDDARPDLWAELSELYLELGEDRWAQATASEAARRDPSNPKLVLQYLRAAQRTLAPDRLINEMETALRRFPGQPEIMLVLARAYAAQGSTRNARILYEAFLQEAPDHPQRARVEAELLQTGG